MDPTEIVAALRGLPVGLRLIVTAGVNGSTIIDDTYNASTPSVLAALNLLAETKGRKVAVLGDMAELGDYAPQEHEKVGMCAARVCDRLYLVGPLGEHTERGALAAGMSPACIDRFETAEEILPELRRSLAEGDVALLKGSRAMHLDALAAQIAAAEEGTS
ncbi:MAG: cyanophycin synthetase [Chloroflexia bacterium]